MHRPTRLKVTDINEHFICVLCDGYLIDATTIVECLHSFCRTCIVRYLENSQFCPVCDVQVHKTKPLVSLKSDVTLQDIVYKLIPGLYQNEMQRRREFYSEHPKEAAKCSSEERGEGSEQNCFYSPQETISLSLEYIQSSRNVENNDPDGINKKDPMTRYLNCPAALNVANLKKFIRQKFGVPPSYLIEILYEDNILADEYTLMDIAYIYAWRRAGPMKFFYSIMTSSSRTNGEVLKVIPGIEDELITVPSVPLSEESDNNAQVSKQKDDERMEVDEPSNMAATTESNASSNLNDLEMKADQVSPITCSDSQQMEAVESDTSVQNANNASPKELPVTSKVELVPQSIHIRATPQHTVIASANSLKMKFVTGPISHKPQPIPPRWKTANATKLKREAKEKATHKRKLARLAPKAETYPPNTVPPHCVTATNITPLSQLTVGKFVPNVITSLAPTLVTALVSTTANSLCSSPSNATLQHPTQFLGQVTTCNVVTCNVTTFSNSFSPSNNFPHKNGVSSSTETKLTTSVPSAGFISAIPNSHVFAIPSVQSPVNILPKLNKLPIIEVTKAVGINQPIQPIPIRTNSLMLPTPSSVPSEKSNQMECNSITSSQVNTLPNTALSSSSSLPVISVLSDSSASVRESSQNGLNVPLNSSTPTASNSLPPSSAEVDDKASATSEKSESSLKMLLTCDKPSDIKETPAKINVLENDNSAIIKSSESLITTAPHNPLINGSCEKFSSNITSSETLDRKEKNSVSAEFSDNDDLGCQSDLVVDEHKIDSSDNEDESDVALREKITAIAEKEDDADDTEADSGRASDMSNQARSSCDDDIGSPNPASLSESDRKPATVTTTTSDSLLPNFTLSVTTSSSTDASNRSAKSKNINHVINNLYRNNEKKDNIGALDLSTSCVRKVGEVAGARSKAVANPVLDIKHKQPSYLGAASKQHTACPPPPKPPTSSLLMQGLTSRTPLVPSQLHGKTPHIPVSTFLGPPSFFSSQSRAVSTSSCTTGRSTPTYNSSRSASSPVPISHSALSLLPLSPGSSQIIPGIPYPACVPNPMAFPYRTPVSISHHHKGISSPPSNSLHVKTSSKQSNSRKSSLDSNHSKCVTSPNSRNGALGVASPATQASYPKTSPSNARMSPLASTAPSPKSMLPSNIPSYKPSQPISPKSIMPNVSSSYKSNQSPIYKKSYKSYNSKFKGSNLAVYNPVDPDHNGYSPKIVIKNLNVKPNSNHHHHHHHHSPK